MNVSGDQLWAWGSWLVAGAAAAVFLWAMLWDWVVRLRKGKARRCPACWYDMEGIGAGAGGAAGQFTCPECGRVSSSAKLLASKRRWAWVAVAAVLVVLAQSDRFRLMWRHGAMAGVPGWVLVRAAPVQALKASGPSSDAFVKELARRVGGAPELTDRDIRTLLRRCGCARVVRGPWPRDVDPFLTCQGIPALGSVVVQARGAPELSQPSFFLSPDPADYGPCETTAKGGGRVVVCDVHMFPTAGVVKPRTLTYEMPVPDGPLLGEMTTLDDSPALRDAVLRSLLIDEARSPYPTFFLLRVKAMNAADTGGEVAA